MTVLELDEEVVQIASALVAEKLMPRPAVAGDAVHVAAAVVHRMDYLLTWNVRHLANLNKRAQFEAFCRKRNFAPPMLATPDLLMELPDDS